MIMKGYRKLIDKVMQPDDFDGAACRGLPCIRVASDSVVCIDGHRGLIEYDTTRIVARAKGRKIIVTGNDMLLAAFSKTQLKIKGRIFGIEFERTEK